MSLVENYTNLIIKQFYNKPKATLEIFLLSSLWQNQLDFINTFNDSFDIDIAKGKQLDIIGKLFNFSRTVLKFDDNNNPIGYQILKDSDYRFFLRIIIASSRTNACMSSDSGNSINDVINYAFKGLATVVDNQNMTLTLQVGQVNNIDTIKLALRLGILPRGQGVSYTGVEESTDDNFNFKNGDGGKGFGTITDKSIGGTFAFFIS